MSNSTDLVRVDRETAETPKRRFLGAAKKLGIVAVAAGLVGGYHASGCGHERQRAVVAAAVDVFEPRPGRHCRRGRDRGVPEDAFVATMPLPSSSS